jgi:hypothetical protein
MFEFDHPRLLLCRQPEAQPAEVADRVALSFSQPFIHRFFPRPISAFQNAVQLFWRRLLP